MGSYWVHRPTSNHHGHNYVQVKFVIFFLSGVVHGGESIRVQQHTVVGAEGR